MNSNKYDYLLVLLIATSAFGFLGTPLYPSRLLSLIVAPKILYELKHGKFIIPFYVKCFFSVWIIFGVFSLLWTYDLMAGLKAVFYHFCNIISFFAVYVFSLKSNHPVKSIFWGWILLLCITVPFALYEFSSGIHFSNAVQDDTASIMSLEGLRVQRRFAAVTFGNLNSYNVIVCFCSSYILSSFFFFKNKRNQLFLWFLLLMIIYIIMMNASRGAFLCLALSLIIFIYNLLKQRIISKYFIFMMLGLAVYIIAANMDLFMGQIFGRLTSTNIVEDNTRMNIYTTGLLALIDSCGLGVGLGGITNALKQIDYNVIGALHNLFLEFLVQFGVIPFLVFIVFLYKIYIQLYNCSILYIKFLGTILCIIFLPLFVIDSAYLSDCFVWIYWGSAFSLSINSKKYD